MHRFLTLLVLATLASLPALAQSEMRGALARRAHLGIELALDAEQRIVIKGLAPKGSAETAGTLVGDLLHSVGGTKTPSYPQLVAAMKGRRAGETAVVEVERAGKIVPLKFKFAPRPLESSDDFGVIYDVVEAKSARLRSIITRPKEKKKHPAILFIQGLQTSTTEFAPGRSNPIQELIYGLTRRGFVVMRCEKSGVGDSTGPAASEVGFDSETEGFAQAFKKLKTYEFVDASRVYIFGHSMGGVMAPLVAPAKTSAGIIAYGTGVRPWSEYLVTNSRRQMQLSGVGHGEIDETLRGHAKVHFHTLIQKWSIEKVEKEFPDLKATARSIYADGVHYGGRHLRFFQELQDVNLPAAWSAVSSPVFAIHGEYDWVCSESDHRYIAKVVNDKTKGMGKFLSLPKTFHGFDMHESKEASLQNPFRGAFNPRLLEEVVTFCSPASQ